MTQGYLALVLHAHLPYVRHPEHDEFLEEHWLFEAITETYIPLIQVFEQLLADRVPFKVSMAVSPSLANMLADSLLMQRYERRLNLSIELAAREIERTAWQPGFQRLAHYYHGLAGDLRRPAPAGLARRVAPDRRQRRARAHDLRRDPRLLAAHEWQPAGHAGSDPARPERA
jgi:glycosyl hydrolase family 57